MLALGERTEMIISLGRISCMAELDIVPMAFIWFSVSGVGKKSTDEIPVDCVMAVLLAYNTVLVMMLGHACLLLWISQNLVQCYVAMS